MPAEKRKRATASSPGSGYASPPSPKRTHACAAMLSHTRCGTRGDVSTDMDAAAMPPAAATMLHHMRTPPVPLSLEELLRGGCALEILDAPSPAVDEHGVPYLPEEFLTSTSVRCRGSRPADVLGEIGNALRSSGKLNCSDIRASQHMWQISLEATSRIPGVATSSPSSSRDMPTSSPSPSSSCDMPTSSPPSRERTSSCIADYRRSQSVRVHINVFRNRDTDVADGERSRFADARVCSHSPSRAKSPSKANTKANSKANTLTVQVQRMSGCSLALWDVFAEVKAALEGAGLAIPDPPQTRELRASSSSSPQRLTRKRLVPSGEGAADFAAVSPKSVERMARARPTLRRMTSSGM